MAAFCVATRMQPSEYRQLTRLERQAFWDLLDKIDKRARKGR